MEKALSYIQNHLRNRQCPVKNDKAGLFVGNVLRISRCQQQSIKRTRGPVWLHRSHRRGACPGDGLPRPPPPCVRHFQGPPCPHLPRTILPEEVAPLSQMAFPPLAPAASSPLFSFCIELILLVQEIFIKHLLCARH